MNDKFCLLKEKYIAKKKEQDKANGIDVEETEIDVLLEEIIEKEKYSQSEYKDKDEEHERKVEKGKASAAGMRQKVMESLRETLKRSRTDSEESDGEKLRKRSNVLKQSNTYKANMSKISRQNENS